jgi:cold shock CspA family protein
VPPSAANHFSLPSRIEARFGNVVASLSKQRLATTPILSNKPGDFRVSESDQRYQGVLKFFDGGPEGRGFGFIIRNGSTVNDFVHARDLERSFINVSRLKDGETKLSYRVEQDQRNKKSKAVDIKILD